MKSRAQSPTPVAAPGPENKERSPDPGQRSGEGSDSVLPYLDQVRKALTQRVRRKFGSAPR